MERKFQISIPDFKSKLDAGKIEFMFDLRNEDEFSEFYETRKLEGTPEIFQIVRVHQKISPFILL